MNPGVGVLIGAFLFFLANSEVTYAIHYFRLRKKGVVVRATLVNYIPKAGGRVSNAKVRFTWNQSEYEVFINRSQLAWQPSRIGKEYEVMFLAEDPGKVMFRSLFPVLTGLVTLSGIITMATLLMLGKIK